MNETTAIAQSMARHERILARVREAGPPVAETPPFARQIVASAPAAPAAPPAPDAPVAAASRAMPGLMAAAGERAAAPPPAVTPAVSSLPAELTADQMDVLLASLGATPSGDAGTPAARPVAPPLAAPSAPAPRPAAEAGMEKSVGRAQDLTPEQMALLMQSFGMAAEPAPGDAPAAMAGSGLPGPPPSADLRFYPVAPRSQDQPVAATAASDAYLRTLRTVKGRVGAYGD